MASFGFGKGKGREGSVAGLETDGGADGERSNFSGVVGKEGYKNEMDGFSIKVLIAF